MTTMTAEYLSKNAGDLRRSLVAGEEVELTFHGKPYARAVAADRLEEERAELERLRTQVAELQQRLQEALNM